MSASTRLQAMQPTDLGIPGPSALDMARAFQSVRADPLSFLVGVTKRFGDLVGRTNSDPVFSGQEKGVRDDRGELEDRVLLGLRNETLHRVVLFCLEVLPRGRGDPDVLLKHRPCLRPAHLPNDVGARVAATSQRHLPGGAGVVHP